MMGKRNVYAYLARQRKAGAHEYKAKEEMFDGTSCPVCLGPFGEQRVVNFLIGEVCSTECLETYWREGGKS